MTPLDATLGLDFINDHMIELANYLETFANSNMTVLISAASGLGAIFALIVAAIQAYKMMTLNGKFEILTIARPILFAFILSQWTGVVSIVCAPGNLIEDWFQQKFEQEKTRVVELREERQEAAWNVMKITREKTAAVKEQEKASEASEDKNLWTQAIDYVTGGFEKMVEIATGGLAVIESYFSTLLENLFVWIGELFWQCHVYFIFLLKAIYTTVLVMFGPIYIVCSILPAWKDTWTQWVGKMVSVSLYGAMAYLVMILSMQLMKYGIQVDTAVLTKIDAGDAGLTNFFGSLMGTRIQTLIGMIVGAWALRTVPEIASWAIPSNLIQGANSFIQGTSAKMTGKVSKGIL